MTSNRLNVARWFMTGMRKPRVMILLILATLVVAGGLLPIALAQIGRRTAGPTPSVSKTRTTDTSKHRVRRTQGQVQDDEIIGVSRIGDLGIQRTTDEIMRAQALAPPATRPRPLKPEREIEGHEHRAQNPDAKRVASWPDTGVRARGNPVVPAGTDAPSAPQTVGLNVDTVTGPTETGAFPPDTMGTIGPTQLFLFVNGRIRTFAKTTGVADAVLNVDPDVFFATVMTPVAPPVLLDFTSDPQIRYDRFTARWYLSIIDVPCTNATCTTTAPNRWMVAVSDAASNGTISGSTVWTFFQFQADPTTNFCDYPSLGVDVSALYVGCDMFTSAGSFVGTNGYVVRKSSILAAGPIFTTTFTNLAAGAGAGPFAPRGVDNYDPAANEGYFIGVDNATFSTLMIRRVSTPGGTPTISGNISLTVPTTTSSIAIQHLGNTGGNNGRIDALDDRLYAAHIRNGRLWTAHNIRVSSAGTGSTAAESREAVRWYELNGIRSTDNGGVPVVIQSGTIFDNAATLVTSRAFLIPTIMVSGQGHAALGYTTAGSPFRIDAATNGRLVGDTLGTTQAVALYTASSTAYNPPGDPGPPRRWGDYSFTSLDPLDDMTMWTVQEYCNGTNTFGAKVAQLLAPPPATPTTGAAVALSQPSVNAPILGTVVSGSGFYDPGANLAAPARPFTHISAVVNGAGAPTVNSVSYTDPTHITLSLNTVGASSGNYTLTITNPDGQQITSGSGRVNGGVSVGPTASTGNVSGRITNGGGSPVGGAAIQLSGPLSRTTITDASGNYHFDNLDTGEFYTVTPELANYHFSPANRSFSLVGNLTDAAFTANADASQSANAIDSAEYFVRQQYLDFLGREPDQGGFDYWTSQFAPCNGDAACIHQKRIDVSAAFFMSGEFQETGSYVYDMYAGLLGRTPAYNEFTPDRAQVVGGSGLDPAKTAFAQGFVQRSEFMARYPASLSREQFVDAVLQTMQQRSGVDLSSQRGGLLADYDTGGRALVARHAAESAMFVSAEYNKAFVLMEYFGYLRRGIDQGGYDFWLNVLNQGSGNNYRGMVCSFLTSTEYQRRFSSVVTHNNGECGP